MDIKKYIEIFSKEIINSYKSIEEHNQNLELISELTKRLAVIELALRNRIDSFLKKENADWAYILYNELRVSVKNPNKKDYISRIFNKIKQEIEIDIFPTNNQIVSRLNFGFWVDFSYYLLKQKSKQFCFTGIINISDIKLEKYSSLNKRIDDNIIKLGFILKLTQKIRNRAFHWENLLKNGEILNRKCKKIKSPAIYVTINKITIGIMPNNIRVFINDILRCLEKEIFEEYKIPLRGESGS